MNNVYALLSADPGDHMYGDGWGGTWMWLWGPLMMVFWVAVVGAVIWLIARATTNPGGARPGRDQNRQAREILAQRYAQGEIDTQEYEERLAKLK